MLDSDSPQRSTADKCVADRHLRLHSVQYRKQEPTPCSFAQQRLWVIDQVQAGDAYNLSGVLWLDGEVNTEALRSSLNEIVRRHETLRPKSEGINGIPMRGDLKREG